MPSYEQIQTRLEQIEEDLGNRQFEYEQAAEAKHKLARDFELRQARAFLAAKGATATERKAQATVALAASEDSLYNDLKQAEGKYEGLKAAIRVLETRATIGQSLLRAEREAAGRASGPQPQWTREAA